MAYNEFAYFYDEFNGEADYDALYSHIHEKLEAHGIRDGIVADLGKLILIPDGVVLALTAIAFQRLETALYGAVALYVSSKVMDTVLYGLNASKVAYIISNHWQKISDAILAYDRGVTILNATGAYSGSEKHVLMVAFRQREIVEIKEIVHEADPAAFLIVCDAHDVLGEGFGEYQKEL